MHTRMTFQRILATPVGTVLLNFVACAPAAQDNPDVMSTGGIPGGTSAAGRGGDAPDAMGGTGGLSAGSGGSGGDTLMPGTGGVSAAGAGTGGAQSTGGTIASGGAGRDTGGIAGSENAGAAGVSGGTGNAAGETGGFTGGAGGLAGGAQGGSGGNGGMGKGAAPSGGTNNVACPAGTFLCEGFENYTAGVTPAGTWTRDVRGAGEINVETSRPFSGTKALHVTGTMNTDRANIRTPLAIAANTVFVRFMMYTASYPSSSGVHTRLMRLGTSAGAAAGTPDSSYSLASYNGTAIEKVNSIYLRSTQTHFNDANVKNRWVCWEFAVDKTGGLGKVVPHIWVDGRELSLAAAGSSSHGMTSASWDPIPIEVFIMGLDGFQSDSVRADFWIDDLVIHSQRIGCPPAN